jgi:hypothetical protein
MARSKAIGDFVPHAWGRRISRTTRGPDRTSRCSRRSRQSRGTAVAPRSSPACGSSRHSAADRALCVARVGSRDTAAVEPQQDRLDRGVAVFMQNTLLEDSIPQILVSSRTLSISMSQMISKFCRISPGSRNEGSEKRLSSTDGERDRRLIAVVLLEIQDDPSRA